jgi:DNA invertase Pin-like site-specific DNA recombinase
MARVSKKNNAYTTASTVKKKEQSVQIFRTALYARLSVEDNGKGADSLEAQLQFLHNYIEGKPQFDFCGEFTDNGFTGTNYNRPGFQELIERVRVGEIDCVIVKDLSRLGRNYIDTGNFIEKICPMLNLRLIAINDGYDTAFKSSSADMSMSVMNIANDMYAKDISRKVCSALQGKIERGEYIGNYAPYGYMKDPLDKNHLIPDPVLVPVVNRIFEMRASGMGIGSIATILNQEDVPSPGRYRYENGIITNNNKKGTGLLWNRHVLTDLLKNVVYIGNLAQARCRSALYKGIPFHFTNEDEWILVENTHEGIVPKEIFEKVQMVNQRNSEAHKGNAGKYSYLPKAVNIYGKRLICADCGAVIKLCRSISTKKDKAYFTFKCPTFVEHRERGCSDKSISQSEMDEAVLATIQIHIKLFIKHKEVIVKLQAKEQRESKRYNTEKDIRDLEKKIQQRESLRTGLYMDLKEGLIDEEEYQFSKVTYSKEISELQQHLVELKAQIDEETTSMDRYSHWIYLIDKYRNIQELNKEVVEAFVQNIKLYENKRIDITLNYMDEFKAAKDIYKKRRREVA